MSTFPRRKMISTPDGPLSKVPSRTGDSFNSWKKWKGLCLAMREKREDDNKRTYKFFVISESELPTFRATQLAKHKKKEE